MSERKHILVVTQYFFPEPFRINDMCVEWVKRGYKVTVVTGIPNYPQGRFYPGYGWTKKRKETWNGVDIIRLPLISRGGSAVRLIANYYSFVISGVLWSLFTRLKADCVYTFEVSPMIQAKVGARYAKRRRIPHYLYVQDLWPDSLEVVGGITNRAVLNHYARVSKRLYEGSTRVLATSPRFVDTIRSRMDGDRDKVLYWPQYAEDCYRPVERRELPEIPLDGRFKIVFTGNIGCAQGLEILPRAAAELKKKGVTNVGFVIIGDGRSKEQLMQAVRKEQADDMFTFIDRQPAERIPEMLAACDAAFISFMPNPLFEQTIPAKLQSYMACGMPILAVANGETERIISEADCGVCTPMGRADLLAAAVSDMMKMPLSRMGQNALAYSRRCFSKDRLLDELDDLWREDTE